MNLIKNSLGLAAVLLLCAVPALAAKEGDPNTITVIQDDGKKVTIELEDPEVILPGTEPPLDMPAKSSEEEMIETVKPPPPPEPKPEPAPLEPKVKVKPFIDEIVAPQAKSKEPAPVKETPKKKETKTKEKAKKAKHPAPPRPPRQKEVQQNIAPGAEISERMANSIAFDAAPPSTGFTTARQAYKGKDVYVVTFKTEDGPYDVLVDVLTGDVVVSGYVENQPDSGPTAPGHLPQDWEPFNPQPVGPPTKQ
jgi:hypothetical protein